MAEEALAAKKRGNAHFVAQRWEEAIKEFTNAIELDATQHVFYSNRSACYAGLQKFDEALTDANKCIEIKPDWAKGYSRKGCALFGQRKYDDAKTAYQEGLKIDPENAALKSGLEDVEAKLKDPMAKIFNDGLWAKLLSNPQTAPLMKDDSFTQKVKMLISNPQMYMTMFMQDPQMMPVINLAFQELGINLGGPPPGSDPSAMQDDDAPEIHATPSSSSSSKPSPSAPAGKKTEEKKERPDSELTEDEKKQKEADAAKEKGNALYKKRKFDEAIAAYTEAVELRPKSPVYLTNRSAVYFMQANYDKCVEDCKKALELARAAYDVKFVAKAYVRLADVAVKRDQLDEAIEYYNQSLLEENSYKIRKKLKAVEDKKAQLAKEAYYDDEKALAAKERGNDFFRAGKFKEAVEEYSESIKRNPKDHKVYANRAGAYSKLMAWEYAMNDCNKCLELQPDFAKAYLRKGKIEHFRKEYQKAITTFNKGLEYEPNSDQLLEAKRAVHIAISQANASGEVDPERQQRALQDPEVQAILRDPNMSKVLEDMKSNPAAANAALADPDIRNKLETLIAAGIVQMR